MCIIDERMVETLLFMLCIVYHEIIKKKYHESIFIQKKPTSIIRNKIIDLWMKAASNWKQLACMHAKMYVKNIVSMRGCTIITN